MFDDLFNKFEPAPPKKVEKQRQYIYVDISPLGAPRACHICQKTDSATKFRYQFADVGGKIDKSSRTPVCEAH
jgi:hypothetical protein